MSRDADSLDARELLAAIVRAPLVAGTSLGAKLGVVGELCSRGADLSEAVAHLGNGVLAEEAFPLALFCFLSSPDDFSGVVRSSVLAGGDTDTVAAMSAAMCGALLGEAALPAAWLARLENGPRGRDHVIALADAVFAATAAATP